MAIYHLSFKSLKRGSGKSAIAHAAYVSGQKLESERTGLTADYSSKEDIRHTEMLFPEGVSPMPRQDLWNAAEAVTIDGQCVGKTGDFALPKEWSDKECVQYAREFLKENFADRGHVVDFAFHKKKGNPHIDYFITQKKLTPQGFESPKQKKVYANTRDENGNPIFDPSKPTYDPKRKAETEAFRIPVIDPKTGLQKVRVRKGRGEEKLWERVTIQDDSLSSRDFLLQIRKAWEEKANAHLAPADRIDCRTLKAQGIDREPQIHLSPTVLAMEKKHPGSMEKVRRNNLIKEKNSLLSSLKKEFQDIQIKMQSIYDKVLKEVQEVLQGTKEQEVQAWKPPQPMQEEPIWLKMHKKKRKTPTAIKEKSTDDWLR